MGSGGHGDPGRIGRVQCFRYHFLQMRDLENGLIRRRSDDEREQIVNPASKSIRVDILTYTRCDLEVCCPEVPNCWRSTHYYKVEKIHHISLVVRQFHPNFCVVPSDRIYEYKMISDARLNVLIVQRDC